MINLDLNAYALGYVFLLSENGFIDIEAINAIRDEWSSNVWSKQKKAVSMSFVYYNSILSISYSHVLSILGNHLLSVEHLVLIISNKR